MGPNPGAWLSDLGPISAIIFFGICLLAVLAIRSFFAAIHKYGMSEGEIRFGLLGISVRWSQTPQDELNASDPEGETSGQSSKSESQEEEAPREVAPPEHVTPLGGGGSRAPASA